MENTTAFAKDRSNVKVKDNVNVELNRLGITLIGVPSLLIACWAVASLFSGMISSGGPANLVLKFFVAING